MKFEFQAADQGFRKGILFLAGRGKPLSSFNITSTGKKINLEEVFRKRCVTCSVEFDEEDLLGYQGAIESDTTMEPLLKQFDPKVKWVVVASSMGAYFASLLPEKIISGMILIDPVTRLIRKDSKIPVHVHLKLTPNHQPDFEFFSKITSYHSHSNIIVHWNASHMIHWDHPGKIIVSIEQFLKR